MFYSFPKKKNMGIVHGAFSLIMLLFLVTAHCSAAEGTANTIQSVTSREINNKQEIRIKGTHSLISTVYALPRPYRIIVDIAEAKLAKELPTKTEFGRIRLAASEIADAKPPVTRLEFTLPEQLSYTNNQDGNDIVLTIDTGSSTVASGNEKGAGDATTAGPVQLQDIKMIVQPGRTVIQLLTSGEFPEYTQDVIEKKANAPAQLVLNVARLKVDPSLIKERTVGTSLAKMQIEPRGEGIRFLFHSATENLFSYKIAPIKSGLEVIVNEAAARDQVGSIISQKKDIESQLPDIDPLGAKLSPQAKEQQMQDAFNFSGYNRERISVEFQKMDLHNVFNFLRQVSGVNIVVDESVQGSLTLVLDNVPWDFALDIILNLKGLEKEERFNTLVIYPKDKQFNWPQQSQNNLSFQADSKVVEQEALVIKKMAGQPIQATEAKQYLAAASELEKRENFEQAVQQYEIAYEKWPENSVIANKIASLYLVQLRQNAKALYFAKKVLARDKNNSDAALNAAIAAANMQDKQAAAAYFDQAVRGGRPSKEALLSYAAFKEEQRDYAGAISLLGRHDALYGKDLDAMVALARIYDKMGNSTQANAQYKSILLSGFRVPPDLENYINSRTAAKPSM